jgi:nicotinamide riboside kinase
MEETMGKPGKEIKCIIFTGPESTGKTMLTIELARRYNAPFIPEYAREYVVNLKRPYTYNDVVHIARKQVDQMQEFLAYNSEFLFIDTYLIITKVWFDKVFKKIPDWLDTAIAASKNCLYLLCRPDIPWEPDPIRENGGPMRQVLFDAYEYELKKANLPYAYIEGMGATRIDCAMNQISNYFNQK